MAQIVFVTFFLGLTMGVRPVELHVTGEVAKVEVVLDRRVVATMTRPPWKTIVDLGSLAPHRLEARGYDAAGNVIASVEQKINAPAPMRELQLAMEMRDGTRVARMIWKNLDATKPDSVEARVDGRPVPVSADGTIVLPRLDEENVHLLHVVVRSAAGDSDAQLVYGGLYEDTATTALTAVPVRVRGRRVKSDGVACKVGEASVRAVALDDLPAEVILVRDPEAVTQRLDRGMRTPARRPGPLGNTPLDFSSSRDDPTLATNDRVRFLWPVARPGKGDSRALLFYPSHAFTTSSAQGLGTLLTEVVFPTTTTERRYADAVAVAGLQAAQSQRPRAVILVVSSHHDDRSFLRAPQVLHYLQRLGVPLYVWSTSREVPEAAKAWGPITDTTSPGKLREAVDALRRDLDTQRILWVEGDHLPAEVAVAHERIDALVR
jgi:hypothetical protein